MLPRPLLKSPFGVGLTVAVVLTSGIVSAQSPSQPPVIVRDSFGRDLTTRGVSLVDWEGMIANPAARLIVELNPRVNLPAMVRLSADGPRLMFSMFSEVGPSGPVKILEFPGPSRRAEILMATFPDRDGADERYSLTIDLTSGVNERRHQTVPVRVIDQDLDRPSEFRLTLDFAHDRTSFFADARMRRITEQAAADWAYFLADQQTDPVAAGAEKALIHDPTTYERGDSVVNPSEYAGWLLYVTGITGPEKRSGRRTSDEGGLQTRDGRRLPLRRSGSVIAETSGNWNGLGWSAEESDDRWWVTSNSAGKPHDYYSIIRHEIGHAILYHTPIPGFGRLVRSGTIRDRAIVRYLGRAPKMNPSQHLFETVDPVSRVGAFGNEYGGDMPRKRWLITKLDLLVAQAVGYRLRETTPMSPLSIERPKAIRLTVGQEVSASIRPSGGIAPYWVRVTRGRLPAGIVLDSFTGAISGTARTAGRTRVAVEARDSDPSAPRRTVDVVFCVESGTGLRSACSGLRPSPTLPFLTVCPLTAFLLYCARS